MRLTIVLFALGLASCQGQHTAPVVVLPEAPTRVTRILFAKDVDPNARICVEVTEEMRLEHPTLDRDLCGYTVGELRHQFVHLSSAN